MPKFPLSLDFMTRANRRVDITGTLHLVGRKAVVEVDNYPSELRREDARMGLVVAVLDGRIKVPDEVAIAVDLIGSAPRVS